MATTPATDYFSQTDRDVRAGRSTLTKAHSIRVPDDWLAEDKIDQSSPTTNNHHHHHTRNPICELRVADSIFLGYICTHPTLDAIEQYRQELIDNHHPAAAHVPYAASLTEDGVECSGNSEGYDDDDEPTGSKVGLTLLKELNRYKKCLRRQSTMKIRGGSGNHHNSMFDDPSSDEEEGDDNFASTDLVGEFGPPVATAIIIVRYFQERLLGVTCGRLRSLYERTAKLALHRHLNYGKDVPFVERYTFYGDGDERNVINNVYGLGAGDTELILNVVPQSSSRSKGNNNIVDDLLNELQFEGMVGSKNELLPRLQNLQADLPVVVDGNKGNNNSIIPIYRYPGNYSGTEWPTHPWSPNTLSIKTAVEQALKPLYNQSMNHCVTNLYRTGTDRIDRHSDKDLDLNRSGVIVSVSIGSKRVMEVRDRVFPHDTCYVELPSGSMFVLGPYTNARFTHAILPTEEVEEHALNRRVSFAVKEENASDKLDLDATCNVLAGGRISLTLRDVRTFLDVKTDRLFGQGISSSVDSPITLYDDGVITEESLTKAALSTRKSDRRERNGVLAIAVGIGAIAGYATKGSKSGDCKGSSDTATSLRSFATMAISTSASYWYLRRSRSKARQQREEREARVFFSKKSASGNKY